jgi:uncharacterized membrane protein YbaN (DUF454 family)
MKALALVAGLIFIALGIAGFAGMIALPALYATVLVAAGAFFAFYGLSRRRHLLPPPTTGNDMRDFV